MLTERQIVELFHLRFVHALFGGLPDKKLIAVKGGINLRFYFGSVRYSEDLDLDITTMARPTLENRVDRLFASPALTAPLKARGISLGEITKPKQTDTVQRWKITLNAPASGIVQHTKVEFSRRDDVTTAELDKVNSEITDAYGMTAVLATHYRITDAVQQKIHALAERSATQPRDVFDLDVLLSRPDAPREVDESFRKRIAKAVENAAKLTYDEYSALVVAYLEPEHRELYESQEAWETMQLGVIERLEALA